MEAERSLALSVGGGRSGGGGDLHAVRAAQALGLLDSHAAAINLSSVGRDDAGLGLRGLREAATGNGSPGPLLSCCLGLIVLIAPAAPRLGGLGNGLGVLLLLKG